MEGVLARVRRRWECVKELRNGVVRLLMFF